MKNQRDPNKSFFLFVHLFDVYAPYDPPKEFLDVYLHEKKRKGLAGLGQMGQKYDAASCRRQLDHHPGGDQRTSEKR